MPSGLVAAYAFNENAGMNTADASGNGNTGVLSGPQWTTAGRNGAALTFDGQNDWVTVSNAAALNITGPCTLEAWVYPTVLPANWRTIVSKDGPARPVYYLHASGTGQRPTTGLYIGGAERNLNGGARLTPNTWTHLAATYDGAVQRLYVNGVQAGSRSQTGAIATSTGPLRMGGNASYGEYFTGRIDDVRVYNRALGPTEIAADMNRAVP